MKKKIKSAYPRLLELGIPINMEKPGPPGIRDTDLDIALMRAGLDVGVFARLFGVQTAGQNGMYPHDVEAVLERMMSGRITGTQLMWD